MATEAQLWALLRTNLQGHFVRIENAISVGVPDVNACHDGVEVWIELKTGSGNYISLRSSQLAWFIRRISVGGNLKVVYRVKDTIGVIKGQDLLAAKDTFKAVINSQIRVDVREVTKTLFHKPFDWQKINETIFATDMSR